VRAFLGCSWNDVYFIGIRMLCLGVTRNYGDHSPLTNAATLEWRRRSDLYGAAAAKTHPQSQYLQIQNSTTLPKNDDPILAVTTFQHLCGSLAVVSGVELNPGEQVANLISGAALLVSLHQGSHIVAGQIYAPSGGYNKNLLLLLLLLLQSHCMRGLTNITLCMNSYSSIPRRRGAARVG